MFNEVLFMTKTSLGLEENVEGALCYLLGAITGILFLVLEKESDFVKFHAMQSTVISIILIVVWIVFIILGTILGMIVSIIAIFFPPVVVIFGLISILVYLLIFLGGLVLWILGMYKAYKGERYKFPIFGDITEDLLKKVNI